MGMLLLVSEVLSLFIVWVPAKLFYLLPCIDLKIASPIVSVLLRLLDPPNNFNRTIDDPLELDESCVIPKLRSRDWSPRLKQARTGAVTTALRGPTLTRE